MWEMIRGYLTFTRKERFGVLFLLIVISILFILPYLFRPAIDERDPVATEKMKEGIQKFESLETDSSRNTNRNNRYSNRDDNVKEGFDADKNSATRTTLFFFDPNNLNREGWHRLGLSDHLTQTILNYIGKGGRFKRPVDLKRLYGLHNSDYERLLPFVKIAESSQDFYQKLTMHPKPVYTFQDKSKTDSFSRIRQPGFYYPEKKFSPIDINQADSAKWTQFPGIGEKLAARIVHYREKLGGFYQVEQVGETFGLPDSTFQRIKPYLRLRAINLVHINLNMESKETLQSHPYIRWQIASGIVAYRLQHGGFQSVEELLQLAQVDSGKFQRLKPYLEVGGDKIR
jgi:competence protein ComEA